MSYNDFVLDTFLPVLIIVVNTNHRKAFIAMGHCRNFQLRQIQDILSSDLRIILVETISPQAYPIVC